MPIHGICLCYVFQQTASVSLSRDDQTVSVMEKHCAYCELGAEALNAIRASCVTVYSVTITVHMKLSVYRVTAATDELVVYYVNILIKI